MKWRCEVCGEPWPWRWHNCAVTTYPGNAYGKVASDD